MAKEDHIDRRTPDEMLDGAVKRITALAEWVIKSFPRTVFVVGDKCIFDFDKGMEYTYVGPMHMKDGIAFEKNFFHVFRRSDGKEAIATKYSESPIKI